MSLNLHYVVLQVKWQDRRKWYVTILGMVFKLNIQLTILMINGYYTFWWESKHKIELSLNKRKKKKEHHWAKRFAGNN